MLKRAAGALRDRFAGGDPAQAFARATALRAAGSPARAVRLLAVAAAAGHDEAAHGLGLSYLLGQGVPPDALAAARWFAQAAGRGHTASQVKLASLHLAGLPAELLVGDGAALFSRIGQARVDFDAAVHWARQAAKAGAPEGQIMLAFILSSGPEHLRDDDAAEAWYARAADDAPQGRFGLGLLRLRRAGTPEATAAAIAEIQQAADAGLALAHDCLGAIYENAVGGPQDFARSVAHYRIAAEAGISRAMERLGLALLQGRGVAASKLDGETWLRRAARAGDANAALRLGRLYAEAGDLPPNYEEAAMWFRRAAEAGHGEAARALGTLYLTGALPRDDAEAASWFSRGAEAGDMISAYNLGVCLARGVGVPRDEARAAFWLERAAPSVPEAQYWHERMTRGELPGDPAGQ
jgi:TPR repeat protein